MGDELSTNIHSGRADGEWGQVLNENDVVAGTKPGMDVVDPSQSGMESLHIPAPPVAPVPSSMRKSTRGAVRRKLSGNLLC